MDWTITVEALQRSRGEVTRKRLAGLYPICKHLRLDTPLGILDVGAAYGGQSRSAPQPADEHGIGKGRRSNWPAVPASALALIVAIVVVIVVMMWQ